MKALEEKIKKTVINATNAAWLEILKELKESLYLRLDDSNGEADIILIDADSGEEVFTTPLSSLVNDYILDLKEDDFIYDKRFVQNTANALEKDAKKLQDCAEKVRASGE